MDSLLRCSDLTIQHPIIPNATVNFLHAHPVHNESAYIPEYMYSNHGPIIATNISYCIVSVGYTHDHETDSVNTEVWLPLEHQCNARLMGIGGQGMDCGLAVDNNMAMRGAVAEGYAALSTDCGHNASQRLEDWLLEGPGKVNMHLLENFASVGLNDAAIIGKGVFESFYGKKPKYSYFSGCSQGGRQGMMLAQRYPDAYDGIVASAHAINWAELLVAGFWTQFVMKQLELYPRACELDDLTNAAIQHCDGLDGVLDGIVSDIDACQFDPFGLLGDQVHCGQDPVPLSEPAAMLATTAWQGPFTSNGVQLWPGVGVITNLTNAWSMQCSHNGTCTGLPVLDSSAWIKIAVKHNRIICPYPERAVYDGSGDVTSSSSYVCSADGVGFESNIRL